MKALRPVLSRAAGVPMPGGTVFDAIERLHAELDEVRALLSGRERERAHRDDPRDRRARRGTPQLHEPVALRLPRRRRGRQPDLPQRGRRRLAGRVGDGPGRRAGRGRRSRSRGCRSGARSTAPSSRSASRRCARWPARCTPAPTRWSLPAGDGPFRVTRTTAGAVLHLALPFVTPGRGRPRPQRRRARRDRRLLPSPAHPAGRAGAPAGRRGPGRGGGAAGAIPREPTGRNRPGTGPRRHGTDIDTARTGGRRGTPETARPRRAGRPVRPRGGRRRRRGGRQAARRARGVGADSRPAASAHLGGSVRGTTAGLTDSRAASPVTRPATIADISSHIATGSAECTYCPICRTVHAVRQTSPEVRAHLAAAASSLLQADGSAARHAAPAGRGLACGRLGRRGGLQRIDLDDPDADDEDDGQPDMTQSTPPPAASKGGLTCGIDIGGTKIAGAVVDEKGRVVAEAGSSRRPPTPTRSRTRSPSWSPSWRRSTRSRRSASGPPATSTPAARWSCSPPTSRGATRTSAPRSRGASGCRWSWRTTRTPRPGASSPSAPPPTSTTCSWSPSAPGVGGGLVLGGELYRGAFGAAAEIGHLRVVPGGRLCGCGNRGCLEQYASGSALVQARPAPWRARPRPPTC